jgi:1-acyl-sn-glycerol-3-phosphate acyltransferase
MTDNASPAELGYSPACRRAIGFFFPPAIKALMRRDWHGHEHVPRTGGAILAPNHLSYADFMPVALFSYQAGRFPTFLIKGSAFELAGLGAFLRAAGQLPVERGQADAALVLKDAERQLAAGECVIVYPEGTASRDPDLWPMVGKTGVARLALATGAPVIPIAHWGAQAILPYGSKRPHLLPRATVRLLAGPPVDLSAFAGKPLDRTTLREATAVVMADITALLQQLRGGQPPAQPFDPVAARRAGRQAAQAPGGAGSPGGDDSPGGSESPSGTERPGDPASSEAAPA